MTTTAKTLRRDVKRAKGPATGAVVKFDRRKVLGGLAYDTAERVISLSYAAIFVAGHWYLTGTTGVGAARYTHDQFVTLLASDDITNVAVATEFEAL